jgi:hypothetical protein
MGARLIVVLDRSTLPHFRQEQTVSSDRAAGAGATGEAPDRTRSKAATFCQQGIASKPIDPRPSAANKPRAKPARRPDADRETPGAALRDRAAFGTLASRAHDRPVGQQATLCVVLGTDRASWRNDGRFVCSPSLGSPEDNDEKCGDNEEQ